MASIHISSLSIPPAKDATTTFNTTGVLCSIPWVLRTKVRPWRITFYRRTTTCRIGMPVWKAWGLHAYASTWGSAACITAQSDRCL